MKNLNKATKPIRHSFLFILLFLCVAGNTADYYISSSEGNDDNDGLSTNSAWKSLLKVSTFRNFKPGDRILLRAGDSFEGPLKITADGSEYNPIKVGRYSSGANPIIYGNHPGVEWSPVAGKPGVFVTKLNGGSLRQVYGKDGRYYDMSTRGTLSLDNWLDTMSVNRWGYDLGFKSTYIKTGNGKTPPNVHLFEFAVVESYKNYIVFENLDVRNGYLGISAGGTGGIIRNNAVSNTIWNGIYLNKAIKNETNNNNITIAGETPIYLMKCQNTWVHQNTISKTVGTILGMPIHRGRDTTPERCGIGAQMGKNNLVEHNNLSNVSGFFDYWYESGTITRFNYCYQAGSATTQGGSNLQLYGNIFNMDGGAKGIASVYEYDLKMNPWAEEGPNLILNNVVNNFGHYGLLSKSSNVIFRNNILRTNLSSAVFVNITTGTSSDYNCFYSASGVTKNGWSMGPGLSRTGYKTIELFRSATGQDENSIFADPKFVVSKPHSADDFKLSASSPCINKGQDLKSAGLLPQNYTDYAGISIPQSLTPDIGAFEYTGTITNTNTNTDISNSTTNLSSLKVNFQDAVSKTPAGWLMDFGQPFGQRTSTNQGTGNKYGWIKQTDRSPLNLTSYGRNRRSMSDTLLATHMHMQANGALAGIWEAQVANGTYDVTVSVGDGGPYLDSRHSIKVEGVPAIINFIPTSGNRFRTATVTVTVTDDRLTVDAIGGRNTKINYITIHPSSGQANTTSMKIATGISPEQETMKSIEEVITTSSLSINKLYPNPSNSNFNITISGNPNQPVFLTIVDLGGRVVETKSGIATNSIIQVGQNLNPGVYILQVVQGTQKAATKINKL